MVWAGLLHSRNESGLAEPQANVAFLYEVIFRRSGFYLRIAWADLYDRTVSDFFTDMVPWLGAMLGVSLLYYWKNAPCSAICGDRVRSPGLGGQDVE